MKTSKRILGIALAVIMILNVFAVGAFAMPDDCVADLILESDKAVYAPGDTITLKVSLQVIEDIDLMMLSGMYDMAYPSAAVEPYEISEDLDAQGFVAIADGYDSGTSGVQIPAANSGTSVPGTDSTICYVVGGDESVTFSASGAPVELFTVNMKIKDDAAPGTYTIAFNPTGYEEYNGVCGDGIGMGGLYGISGTDYGFAQENMYNFGSVTFTISAGKVVFHEKAQYNTRLTTDTTAVLGFVGNFDKNDIGFEFAENGTTLTNIAAVGVHIVVAGVGPMEGTADAVYLKSGTEYNFRAIINDFDLAQYADATIEVVYYVLYTDGTSVQSETFVTTANQIINK